ncbi:Intracellular protein transport-like protein [Apiospora marii]|uniref:Intracellular protein transport-like protein n=1 Tax=Apiospora marii TaxID=335849 RepID=A0ABR1SFP6_9PEZI
MEPVNDQYVPQRRPSLTLTSETLGASSDVSSPLPPSLSRDQSTTAARNTRNLVIDSSVILPSQNRQSIRRKPLSSTASPIVSRYSSGAYLSITRALPRPEQRYSRSFSLDSPTVYEFPLAVRKDRKTPVLIDLPPKTVARRTSGDSKGTFSILEDFPLPMQSDQAAGVGESKQQPRSPDHHDNPAAPQTVATTGLTQSEVLPDSEDPLPADADDGHLSVLDGYDSDSSRQSNYNQNPVTPERNMSLFVNRKPPPPHLALNQTNPEPHAATTPPPTNSNHEVKSPNTDKPLPKSPGSSSSKLGTFFSWGSPSPATTEFSPLPSPYAPHKSITYTDASPVTTIRPSSLLEAPKGSASSRASSREYCESYLATPPNILPSHPAEIKEMEEELKAISAELASSIRREMDLEDLVDRLQSERDNPTSSSNNKRTSDYFSDSGYSSTKFSDYDQSREEVDKIQRKAEQEMAQVRLELTNKLQDERSMRQQLDDQIKDLSHRASQIDLEKLSNADDSDRVKELENTCETLRRKLTEERQVKDNFEDLLTVLKGELQNAANERDNLRDEVVPQLRARVEGLEAQATDLEKMSYESTKMQQELQSLREEKEERSIGSIAEESSRLSRSSSVTGPPPSFRLQRPPSMTARSPALSRSTSLTRSKSVKTTESRDALSDRLKDVEEQRDALHRALKALLERQECQNRENEKKIRALELERERLLTGSPQRAGFVKEVSNLREEINVLRRRSEEALEQRWQVEKGLAGIKMDLDRAEQEIATLRSLLNENDILIPENLSRSSAGSDGPAQPVTSDSLRAAYRELQEAYAESLERLQNVDPSNSAHDEKTKLAIEKLEQSLSSAVSERDLALQEASAYKAQLDALKAQEQTYLESEKTLADELHESARRVEELALQVRQQLAANQNLRQRLTDTVARGETSQKANADHITALQARLRTLEEQVVAAQTASEERVSRHEDEILTLRESHSQQLSRLSGNLSPHSPRMFQPKSPMSPMFATGARSPRLDVTRSGSAMSVAEETQVTALREKVTALEKALAEADSQMQEVVSRMNTAQIEVLELQEEREAAVNQARKLEKALQAEKVRAFEDRFKALQA